MYTKFGIQTGQQLTMLYLKFDVLLLADVSETFVQKSIQEYKINPLYFTYGIHLEGSFKIRKNCFRPRQRYNFVRKQSTVNISSVMCETL